MGFSYLYIPGWYSVRGRIAVGVEEFSFGTARWFTRFGSEVVRYRGAEGRAEDVVSAKRAAEDYLRSLGIQVPE